ncbi:GAP family protein [Georgenia sp. EYE_87]|uniref:GAP family protein n=1 Tax=Georgenia sp. EYE_87 TaxID=2853448 RepID=UPI002006AA87|nr:GAP family protein [Georgenia sp. EYE_87]MCK6208991.1 GAP family protein [Georgenia sp. EYE_87]
MSAELVAPLVVLALIDSTSFGTLLIPLWLLLTPGRLRPGRILVFLATVAVFYLVVGVALLGGALAFLDQVGEGLDSPAARMVQLVVGVVLLVLGLTIEPLTKAGKEKRAARRAARQAERGPGRVERWRARAGSGEGPVRGLVGLALTATTVELGSMLPYLGAIGLLSTSGVSVGAGVVVLAGYCLVMIAPALVLLALRVVLHERVSPSLARLEDWLSRNSREALAWVLFFLGLYLTGGAVQALGIG